MAKRPDTDNMIIADFNIGKIDALYTAIIDSSNDAIISKTLDGTIRSWNNAAERIFGYTTEEIVGKHISVLIPKERLHEEDAIIARLRNKEKIEHYETIRLHKDGSPINISVTISPIIDVDGKVIGASKIARDISDKKSSENELAEKADRLQKQANEILEVLLNYVIKDFSHQAPVTEVGDELDAIAVGLNTLGEELKESLEANKNYIQLLEDLNSNLEKIISARTAELAQYKYALDESSIIEITDVNGIIIHANDNKAKVTGYSKEEMIGHDTRIVSSGHHSKEFIKEMWDTIQSGKVWKGEFRNKAKNGTLYWVDTTIVPFLDAEGKPYQYMAIKTDITQKKKNEEEIAIMNKRFGYHLTNSPLGVVEWTNNMQVNKWAGQAEHILGWTEDEVKGKMLNQFNLIFKDDFEIVIPRVMELINGTVERNKLINRCYNKNGEVVYLEWHNSVLKDDEGKVLSIMSLLRDITESHKIEQERIEHATELEAVNKELESFSYSVSHDLRAPLRAIDGYAQMIEEDYTKSLDNEGNRLLGVVRQNAQYMGQLIDDLLNFSRLGRKELIKARVNMQDLTDGIIHDMRENEGVTTKIIIHPLHSVLADSSLMNNVMVNLVSNAVKYSSKTENAVVEISSTQDENETVFTIKDNGAGFDMEYADKLFGVFQRLHTNDEFEGTGVGLATVQRIIHKHNGHIWAKGEVNKGATFYFSLPNKA